MSNCAVMHPKVLLHGQLCYCAMCIDRLTLVAINAILHKKASFRAKLFYLIFTSYIGQITTRKKGVP